MGFSAAQLVFFSVLALLLVNVHAEPTSLGFVSIDCGLSGRPYVDEITNISYVSDDAYIATGEKHEISSEYRNLALYRSGLSLRSFPSGGRNCYAVAAAAARGRSKYLVRAWFMHGDYDGGGGSLASTPVRFDLYIGLAFWFEMTVSDAATTYAFEAITVAAAGGSSSSLSVCLVDTGHGTPFVSSLEVRPMSSDMYPDAVANQSLGLFTRGNMGASYFLRYPEDPYDRFWWTPSYGASSWLNVSARDTSSISYAQTDHIRVPVAVLRTAITTANTSVPLVVNTYSTSIGRVPPPADAAYFHFLHFADFDQQQQQQQRQKRRFDIYYGSSTRYVYRNEPVQLNPIHNRTTPSYYASGAYSLSNVSLVATNGSVLPPLLNAMEVYYSIPHDGIATAPHDVDAIMAIKTEYQVKKNWMGDPCLPKEFIWTGLQCRREGTEYKIISLDLSGNHFNGTLPEALCTKSSLNLRYDTSNGDPCNGMKSPKKKNISVRTLTVAIVTPVVAVLLVSAVLILCFCKKKRKQNVTEGLVQQYSPCSIQPTGTPDSGSHVDLKDHIQMADDHEFTYEELVRITNNFSDCIGEGGFGPVYRGQLQDSVQVAVKKSSRASLHGQGIREFLAEINSLQTVHHRHLVLLIGYCTNRDHLALIYEYMPNGSLFDHIRGLNYLHSGCVLPIIHRDVKSHNILLGEDMHAKISDFGLSKSYINEAQTHISVTAAGTIGYIDPEYYFSSRLTMRSDVFSFGVVLLETVTGEPPIVPGVGHVVQRVKQKVSDGDISAIVDPHLEDAYDIGSVWKVVDIALLCTREVSDDRPTMTEVVEQLKHALALEEARHIDGHRDNGQGSIKPDLSANWGPLAR
uniref:Protein kinase domain-containing protein n=1 Tax=Oryza meridionalis TaxID=40149 RepID=A0A0E0ERA0_9ORYZ